MTRFPEPDGLQTLCDLWHRLTPRATGGWQKHGFTRLVQAYGLPHRHHHDMAHLGEMHALYNALVAPRLSAPAQDVFGFALFGHDMVYDPQAPKGENERRSAQTMHLWLVTRLGAGAIAGEVAHWINATQTHAPTGDPAVDMFLDTDCAILGATPQRYARYAAAVQAEYVTTGTAPRDYKRGRIAFLRGMLARERVFITTAYAIFEARARRNMRLEIKQLTAAK